MKQIPDNQIIIIGAGPAGLSFARQLEDTGLSIALIEKQTEKELADPAYDGREGRPPVRLALDGVVPDGAAAARMGRDCALR